ncbi:MAG: 2-isopropylmalate synthase, partial [SAR324 cluster bacterium]|nr:2-isopropylmalate synthase [SAR324 cluster bacterium]
VKAGLEVEYSPEGYSRMADNFDFVTDVIRAAVEGGASVINCPDTIGGACWLQGEDYFVEKLKRHAAIIKKEFPEREITWSTHCHNDFGMAVQNSLNAVFFGPARQIEGCINGVGERAGNTSLEQCIMIIKHFAAYQDPDHPFFTRARIENLQKISDFVNRFMLPRQPHWPIAGENAAKHSSGGHTNAVLRNPLAYQPFDPRETGKEITFLFGPLSGGNHAKSIIEQYGYVCEDSEKAKIAQFLKDFYIERRKGITDEELLHGYFEYRKPINIQEYDYSKHKNVSELRLVGRFFDHEGEINQTAEGKDSALATLKLVVDKKFPGLNIHSYSSESIGSGISATSRSTIVLVNEERELFEGRGEDQDIEISAMKALLDAVNRAYVDKHFRSEKRNDSPHDYR